MRWHILLAWRQSNTRAEPYICQCCTCELLHQVQERLAAAGLPVHLHSAQAVLSAGNRRASIGSWQAGVD